MNTLLIADGSKLTSAQIDSINDKFGDTYINYLSEMGNKGKSAQVAILKDANSSKALHDITEIAALLEATHIKASKVLKKRLQKEGVKVKFV